ncbi:MAG: prepilin-type N-terminal cleavage/methylation domain-containing protein [Ruminococcus sp.]|nr:prepilin-type N-terminal cleavage/methylation domain-containing protein [Ruminococcus sp.]
MKKLKLKLRKKVLKGMTLLEIIIAIAIVAVMTSVLVATSNAINSYLRSANDINDRVAIQAPVAQGKSKNGANVEIETGVEIILSPEGVVGNISLIGDLYAVYDSEQMTAHQDEFGGGLNMRFIDDIQTETGTAAKEDEGDADDAPDESPEEADPDDEDGGADPDDDLGEAEPE